MNFLIGNVVEKSGDSYRVAVGENTLTCPVDPRQDVFGRDAKVVLGIRPERLYLDDAQQPAGRNVLRGRILREKFVGKSLQYEVDVGSSTVVIDADLSQGGAIGANVQIIWDAAETHIYPFKEDREIDIGGAGDIGSTHAYVENSSLEPLRHSVDGQSN